MRKLITLLLIIAGFSTVTATYSPVAESAGLDGIVVESSSIIDGYTGIHADIRKEKLGAEAYKSLRNYYNNRALSDRELFGKYIELKKSYVNALGNLYNTNYLGSSEKEPETAMKIYYEGREKLFGAESFIYLYNIAVYKSQEHTEHSYLHVILPVYPGNSVITANFAIPREHLGAGASAFIMSVLREAVKEYGDMELQCAGLSFFNNPAIISGAKLGIFPAVYLDKPDYIEVENETDGYSLLLPDTYVPFVQNSLGGQYMYSSYKINPNRIFSISSEPLGNNTPQDAISRFKVTSLSSVRILEDGRRYFGNNRFDYIHYTNTENGVKKFFYTYFIQGKSRLYKLQFQCDYSMPEKPLEAQMEKILASFRIAGPKNGDGTGVGTESVNTVKYLNREEGYSFIYPDIWRLDDISRDIAHDLLKLHVPGLSGVLEITFQESTLKDMVTFLDLMKSVEGNSVSAWPALAAGYDPPFAGKASRLLFTDYSIDGPVSTIYRLSVYIDDDGKNRLCYSIDIIKEPKIYSMFITASELHAKDGAFLDGRINKMINTVASSFRLEKTPESENRARAGETRNRKLVFVENYLKRLIDPNLEIISVGSNLPDGVTIVEVGHSADSGYYRVKLDYPSRRVEVLDRVLKSEILRTEAKLLKEKYTDGIITGEVLNETNMTILLEFEDYLTKSRIARVYAVDVISENGRFAWNTRRIAGREDYIQECKLYVRSVFSPDAKVYIYGDNAFEDIKVYAAKKLKYPVLVYTQSDSVNLSGFFVLSADAPTSLFKIETGFRELDYFVREIEGRYGIKAAKSPGSVKFDPQTFILNIAPENGNDGALKENAAIERFKIYYHPEKRIIEYEKINS